MARAIEKQQFGPAFQKRPERNQLVSQIGAGAMDEDDRREIGVFRRRHMDIMQTSAVDLGEVDPRTVTEEDIGLMMTGGRRV